MNSDFDFTETQPAPPEEALDTIHALVEETNLAGLRVADLEEQLKAAKKDFIKLSEKDLPEALADVGLVDFTTISGLHVSVKDSVRVSLPVGDKVNYAKGLAWFRENGHGANIRHTVSAVLGRNSMDDAEKVAAMLRDSGYDVEDKVVMPPPTIASVGKEILAQGAETLPEDVFKVFRKTVAVIK